jgi:hypothetical protein
MKPILICLLFVLTLSAKGQIATINDPDGFTNVRAGKGANTKVIGKLVTGDMFLYSCEDKKDQWAEIFCNGKTYLQGYIHISRLMPIDQMKHIPESGNHRLLKNGELKVYNDSIMVMLTTKPFIAKQHVLKKDSGGYIKTIDGMEPNGTDGDMPHVQLVHMEMLINGKTVIFPASVYKDMYEPELTTFNVYFDNAGVIYLYIPASSDGAGAYTVAWAVKDGRFIKRYVDGF